MRAQAGRSASFAPSRATSASRGSSRDGMAASVIPCGAPVGRSLSECTAKSTSRRSRLSRNALTKTPVPPICVSCSLLTSPSVVTPTMSTGRLHTLSASRQQVISVADPAAIQTLQLDAGMVNQETGVRGYALSAPESFLQPYTSGLAQQRDAEATLRGLLA